MDDKIEHSSRVKLLSRPPQYPDECIIGYLTRLSECNGFNHLGHLLRAAGLEWKNNRAPINSILSGKYKIDILLARLGIKYVESKLNDVCHTFRKQVDTHQIIAKSPRVCPDCLHETGYVNYKWALLPIIVCTKHNKLLIDTNSTTGKSLNWYRKYLARYDGTRSKIETLELPIKRSLFQQSALFEDLLQNNTSNKPPLNVFTGLDFREALTIVHFIAHYQQRLMGATFSSKVKSTLELAQVYSETWSILKVLICR